MYGDYASSTPANQFSWICRISNTFQHQCNTMQGELDNCVLRTQPRRVCMAVTFDLR